ncbi:hypothetical protein Patl1_26349 [Pistacia atlantica]|uniref:Uncharacterized protein n=1 Tax=Pistacia atlantica TaxID=434234 RepID=A0ACC1B2D7_9ROSI|nr:hypothetical protein Patl1_26349 [Pistacia atlantica]
MVSSPHPISCIKSSSYMKDRFVTFSWGSMCSEGLGFRVPRNYVKAIACGGRHSAYMMYSSNIVWASLFPIEEILGKVIHFMSLV